MESRARLSMAEKALIIELYVVKHLTLDDIADLFEVSKTTIKYVTDLYFKKPNKDVVKMSKV